SPSSLHDALPILDAPEFEPGRRREALGEEGLGGARRSFEQDMALRDERDEQVLDHVLLADDRLGDLSANGRGDPASLVERRSRGVGHGLTVLSMVLSALAARSNSAGWRARRSASARSR